MLLKLVKPEYKTEKEMLPEPLFLLSRNLPLNETPPLLTNRYVRTSLRGVGY
jgi:hypothetical protein